MGNKNKKYQYPQHFFFLRAQFISGPYIKKHNAANKGSKARVYFFLSKSIFLLDKHLINATVFFVGRV